MRRLPVTVDSYLTLDPTELPADAVRLIRAELTIENKAKLDAKKRKQWEWWELPDEFQLYEVINLEKFQPELVLPRGYALRLKQLLRTYDIKVRWIDRRRWRRGAPYGKEEFAYLALQPEAVDAMRRHQQGMYKSPTGSGKTVCGVGLLWEMHPERALILVDRINLVTQWERRIKEHGGDIPVGRIGEGEFNEQRVTIATVQTLYRHRDRLLSEGFFDKWDVVILDECHHVTAEMFLSLIQLFTARVRLGMSATPDKTGIFEFALAVLGPVIAETTHEDLRAVGRLVRPRVEVIHTGFEHVFWGDHEVEEGEYCDVPNCRRSARGEAHRHRNNYAAVKRALVLDPERNQIIASKIEKQYREGGHHQLVISDQTQQIEAIRKQLNPAIRGVVHVLTGKMTGKKRDEAIAMIESSEQSIILSTIAGEALDIPVIDRVHLPFPTKNHRKTEQNIGRGLRVSEGKSQPIIFDYADVLIPPLAKQFMARRWRCYEPLGYEVVIKHDRSHSKHSKRQVLHSNGTDAASQRRGAGGHDSGRRRLGSL